MKSYNKESDKGYFFEFDAQYPEKLHDVHNYLPFLPERMKTKKFGKLVSNLHDKTDYVVHIKNLKQALTHELVSKKLQRIIKFKQKAWLKSYINMNRDIRKIAKSDFEKNFLSP